MCEQVLPKEQLVKSDSDGPDVSLAVVHFVIEYFWSHIQRRPQNGFNLLVLRLEEFGEPEVGDFNYTVVAQDIRQFKVAMHDLVLDQGLEGMQDLDDTLHRFFLREPLPELQIGLHIPLVAVFEDQVDVVRGFFDVHKFDYVVIAT